MPYRLATEFSNTAQHNPSLAGHGYVVNFATFYFGNKPLADTLQEILASEDDQFPDNALITKRLTQKIAELEAVQIQTIEKGHEATFPELLHAFIYKFVIDRLNFVKQQISAPPVQKKSAIYLHIENKRDEYEGLINSQSIDESVDVSELNYVRIQPYEMISALSRVLVDENGIIPDDQILIERLRAERDYYQQTGEDIWARCQQACKSYAEDLQTKGQKMGFPIKYPPEIEFMKTNAAVHSMTGTQLTHLLGDVQKLSMNPDNTAVAPG